ncbi:MAG: 2-oxoacid:acceptor oxidoreductase family protein [Ignavibacteriales bacterium]|nr:2-oxoacid:acceptor oxidoreductase family protein [Ignavibacteriales bacterium]
MNGTHEIIIAGFGGQGVLSMGQILAYAAMIEGKEVSWMPSYGPEMRGGTANCIVIISEKRISSPIVSMFDSGIILNQPSMDKFRAKIKPGGLLLYEQSTIIKPPTSAGIEILSIVGLKEAQALGSKQVANVVMLGAFLERKPIVSPESVMKALRKVLPAHRQNLLPVNEKALARGKDLVAQSIVTA